MQGRFLPSPKWTFHKWVRHTVSSVFYIALFFNSIRVGGQKPSTADLMQLCSTNSLYQPWSTTELRHAHPIFLKVTHKLQKIPPQQMWPISVIPGDVCLLRREWGRRSQVHLSVLHDAMRMWRKECGLSPLQSQDCYLLGSFNSAGHSPDHSTRYSSVCIARGNKQIGHNCSKNIYLNLTKETSIFDVHTILGLSTFWLPCG